MIQPAATPLYAAERLDMLRAANTVFDHPPHLPQAELAATSRAQAASTSVYLNAGLMVALLSVWLQEGRKKTSLRTPQASGLEMGHL